MCMYACGHMWVSSICLPSLSVSPLLTLSLSFCSAVLSALMTHISYLQLLPNPSSAGSGTDYCSQTPEERGAKQGGGWRVERDASVIQYTGGLRRPGHACERAHICMHVNILSAERSSMMPFHPFTLTFHIQNNSPYQYNTMWLSLQILNARRYEIYRNFIKATEHLISSLSLGEDPTATSRVVQHGFLNQQAQCSWLLRPLPAESE